MLRRWLVSSRCPCWFTCSSPGSTGSAPPVAFGVPVGRGGWQGPLEEEGSKTWKPDFVGPHSQWSVAYRGPEGHSVEMVAIGYSVQGQGRELVNEENALFGASVKLDTVAEDKVTLGRSLTSRLWSQTSRGGVR